MLLEKRIVDNKTNTFTFYIISDSGVFVCTIMKIKMFASVSEIYFKSYIKNVSFQLQ